MEKAPEILISYLYEVCPTLHRYYEPLTAKHNLRVTLQGLFVKVIDLLAPLSSPVSHQVRCSAEEMRDETLSAIQTRISQDYLHQPCKQ